MKRKAKRLLVMLLCCMLTVSTLPVHAYAETGIEGEYISDAEGIAAEETEVSSEPVEQETILTVPGDAGEEIYYDAAADEEQPDEEQPDEEQPDEEPLEGFDSFFAALRGYAEVKNDETYPFAVTDVESALYSTNKAVNNSKSYITITAKKDFALAWSYKTSSELRYDYMSVALNGSDLHSAKKVTYSGNMEEYRLYTIKLSAGDVLQIGYAKDSSGNSGDDTLWLKDFWLCTEITFTGAPTYAVWTVTDKDGNNHEVINGTCFLSDGEYTYHVEAFGYKDADGSFAVSGQPFQVEANMQKSAGYQVTFEVSGTEEGKDYRLTVKHDTMVLTPEEDGTYSLVPGEYTYQIEGENYKAVSNTFEIVDEDITVPVALESIPTIDEYLSAVLKYAYLENDSTYPLIISESGQDMTNSNSGKASSTSSMKLTFKSPVILSFDYTVSSELSYDKIKVYLDNQMIKEDSGENSGTITAQPGKGSVLTISYEKDSSGDRFDDRITVKNFVVQGLYTISFTGHPSGANISLTDEDGQSITVTDNAAAVSSGSYSYTISAFGYEDAEGTVVVEDRDETVEADMTRLSVKKLTFNIRGVSEEVTPVIVVNYQGIDFEAEEDGSYLLIPAEYSYKVKADGYISVKGTVVIEDDTELTLTLKEGREWDGDVSKGLEGEGTEEEPYLIQNEEDLACLSEQVNNGNSYSQKYIKLTTDLYMGGGICFTPIGTGSTKAFKGYFNGDGHVINDLYISTTNNYAGLFGYVERASISGVTVTGKISGKQYVGGIAGYAYSSTLITNCMNQANVSATGIYAGGIVGRVNGIDSNIAKITGCVNSGSVSNGANNYCGGITGYAQYVTVSSCYNTGSVVSNRGGGIVGQEGIAGSFENLYSIGSVTMAETGSYNYAGALVGYANNEANWKNCYYLTAERPAGNIATLSECTAVSSDTFKGDGIIPLLGGSFTNDTENINNGYPIVGWQDPNASFYVQFSVEEGCTITVKDENGSIVSPEEMSLLYKLSSGTYSYKVEKEEYVTVEDTFIVDGAGTTIEVEMVICTYPVNVTIEPADAEVTAVSEIGTYELHSGSNALPKGSYTYTASLFGYETKSDSFTVTGDEEADTLQIELDALARYTLAISAKDEDTEEELEDLTVEILHSVGGAQSPAADGSYSLIDGTYSYTITCPGYLKKTGTVVINGQNAELAVKLTLGSDVWTGEMAQTAPKIVTVDEVEYYLITSSEELAWAKDQVNNQGNTNINLKLATNLILNSEENSENSRNSWDGIGNYTNQYTGIFDGNGKSITGLYSTSTGLFGYVGADGLVKDLTLSGNVTGENFIAGFANHSYGSFEHCISNVDITIQSTAAVIAGGIVGRGYSSCVIANSANYGTITCTGSGNYSDVKLGGIVGDMYGTVEGSANLGAISSTAMGSGYIGGIMGSSNGNSSSSAQIRNCYNRGSITSCVYKESYFGGIAGRYSIGGGNVLENCYNTGTISIDDENMRSKIGAIAGTVNCDITNCYYPEESAFEAVGYKLEGNTIEATALTEEEWKSQTLVINLDNTVWGTVEGEYPAFLWQGAAYVKAAVAVTVTSGVDGAAGTVAQLQGGGIYETGDSATVSAPAMAGYTFNGWYDGQNKVCSNLNYTFTVSGETALTARYTANASFSVSITGTGNAKFFVDGFSVAQSELMQSYPAGTVLKITAADADKVSAWYNGNGKKLGTSAILNVTVTGDMTIKLSYKNETSGTATVRYCSYYEQLIAMGTYSTSDTITPPFGPSRAGYRFIGWSMTPDQIGAKIREGETEIIVKPVYEATGDAYTVIIEWCPDGNNTFIQEIPAGTMQELTAKGYDGMTFSYWADADDNILSYSTTYNVYVNADLYLKAVYDEEVTAEPVITMSQPKAFEDGGNNKISFTTSYDVPEGHTLVEAGIIRSSSASDDSLVIGGANVKRHVSKSTGVQGTYTVNVSVGTQTTTTVYARGYLIYKDESTGNLITIYTVETSGSFESLIEGE